MEQNIAHFPVVSGSELFGVESRNVINWFLVTLHWFI